MRRGVRGVAYAVLPAEVALVLCLLAGVSVPMPVIVAAEAAVTVLVCVEALLLAGAFRRHRSGGLTVAGAAGAALRDLVPEPVLRLMAHEARAAASIGYLVTGRRNGVRGDAVAIGYAREQTPMMIALLVVCVIEVVVLAIVLPWPVVHAVVLVLGVYTVVMVLSVTAAGVTRPHVVGPAELRLRWCALFDLRVPVPLIESVRVDRRYSHERLLQVTGSELSLAVSSQTNLVVELAEPVTAVRPLGATVTARRLRVYADDPDAAVAAIRRARDAG
ncbi:hypothetical protein [Streptosporangium sp. NPDC087985]|uniref:hypothetical protein n=1 Tax=Streptosporangium sp. NPDC087985 TaxID=3366196 RepID=UPI00382045FC